jgi:hypothetical protein
MTTTAPPRRWRRRLLWLLLLPALAAAGLWAYVAWQFHRSAVSLADAVAEADRLDPHWRVEDLQAGRAELPDDRNAALRILALKPKLPANYPDNDTDQAFKDLAPPARLTAPQRVALAKLLAPVAGLLPEARGLADLPAGRFPLSLTPSFIGAKIYSQEARPVLHPLHYDLLDRLEAGDAAGALTAWRAAFSTGRAIGDEPLILSQLIRIACRTAAVTDLERLLAQTDLGDADLARMQRELEADEPAPLFLYAVRGERAGGFQTIEDLKVPAAAKSAWSVWRHAALGVWDKRLTVSEAIALMPGSLPGQQAALLRHETRLVEIARRPVDEWGPLMDAWSAEANRLPALTRMLAPAVGKIGDAVRRSHAELRCAAAAVAAERFRRANGRWPATLDNLVAAKLLPAVPTDPFDGKPLRLKRTADGLVIYSVGPDGTDDGGAVDRRKPLVPGTDWGLRLWDVSARRQAPPAAPGGQP